MEEIISACYEMIGSPVINFGSCWEVYSQLLLAVRDHMAMLPEHQQNLIHRAIGDAINQEDMEEEGGTALNMPECPFVPDDPDEIAEDGEMEE